MVEITEIPSQRSYRLLVRTRRSSFFLAVDGEKLCVSGGNKFLQVGHRRKHFSITDVNGVIFPTSESVRMTSPYACERLLRDIIRSLASLLCSTTQPSQVSSTKHGLLRYKTVINQLTKTVIVLNKVVR